MTYTEQTRTIQFQYGFMVSLVENAINKLRRGESDAALKCLVSGVEFIAREQNVLDAIAIVSVALATIHDGNEPTAT